MLTKKQIATILLILTLLILTPLTQIQAEELKVHFIDVGQGDSILIQSPEEKNMLIDGGDRWDWVGEKIVNYLEDEEINTIHALVSTHPHADHIGGLSDVIKNFKVKKIYDSGRIHTTQTYENYLRLIDAEDIPFSTPRRGETISLGGLDFKVLHPKEDVEQYSLNNASLVLQLDYQEVSFLFTGDAEKEAEKQIIERFADLESEILKVGHHGSYSSTTAPFLKAANPEVAVIPVGTDNRYGHPHKKVISRLEGRGVRIYRTDYHETVVVTTDGSNYEVKTEHIDPKEALQKDLININTAPQEKLESLPGIGPVIAERIIEYRNQEENFKNIREIKKIRGVGPGRFENIKDKIAI